MIHICFCEDDTCIHNENGTCGTDCKHEIRDFNGKCFNVCTSYQPTEEYKKERGDIDAD